MRCDLDMLFTSNINLSHIWTSFLTRVRLATALWRESISSSFQHIWHSQKKEIKKPPYSITVKCVISNVVQHSVVPLELLNSNLLTGHRKAADHLWSTGGS